VRAAGVSDWFTPPAEGAIRQVPDILLRPGSVGVFFSCEGCIMTEYIRRSFRMGFGGNNAVTDLLSGVLLLPGMGGVYTVLLGGYPKPV
jgi:hypothetical protein